MELRHLRYFVAVAEVTALRTGRRKLRIAQPSLSHQIAFDSMFNQGGVVYCALRRGLTLCKRSLRGGAGDPSATLAEFISAARRMLSHTAPILR